MYAHWYVMYHWKIDSIASSRSEEEKDLDAQKKIHTSRCDSSLLAGVAYACGGFVQIWCYLLPFGVILDLPDENGQWFFLSNPTTGGFVIMMLGMAFTLSPGDSQPSDMTLTTFRYGPSDPPPPRCRRGRQPA